MKNRNPKSRCVDGILLLDKPVGITSNAALQSVKRLYNARKAGHTGSLDPIASGMLPICLGKATKFAQFLLESNKSYHVIGKLGIKTVSGDVEGEVIEQRELKDISNSRINEVLNKFRGEIKQVPSMYSAIKYKGKPLYKLARQNITVEREARPVTIHRLELLGYKNGLLELEVCCTKGTYIRTLIDDIGDELCCGGHVVALQRLQVGDFREEQMVTLQQLQENEKVIDSLLLPVESMVANWPAVKLSEAAVYYLQQGQAIIAPYAPASGMVRLVMKNGRFFGIGEVLDDGKLAPRRLL